MLTATTGAFHGAMRRAIGGVRSMGTAVVGLTKRMFSLHGAIGAALAGGSLVYLVKRAYASVDAMAKLSDRIGITTQALQGLRHAAGLAGVEQGQLDNALAIMVRRLGEARAGTGEAAAGLKMLRLSADQLIGAGPEEAFKIVAERISRLGNASEQAAAAYYIFGRAGANLVNLLRQGRGNLDDWISRVTKMGAVTREQASRIEMANDAFATLRLQLSLVGSQIASVLAPYLKVLADDFTALTGVGGAFGAAMDSAIDGVIKNIGKLMSAVDTLRVGWLYAHRQFLLIKYDDQRLLGLSKLAEDTWKRIHELNRQIVEIQMAPPVTNSLNRWFDDFLEKVKRVRDEAAKIGRKPLIPQILGPIAGEIEKIKKGLGYQPIAATVYGSAADISARARFSAPRDRPENLMRDIARNGDRAVKLGEKQVQALGEIENHLDRMRKAEWPL